MKGFSPKRSFTYLELLVVLIIIGIVAGVSIPRFRSTFDNFELENFAKNIFYLSQHLQAEAITQKNIYCLNISLESKEFWGTARSAQDGAFRKLAGRFSRHYKAPENCEISLEPAGQAEIFFFPDSSSGIGESKITFKNSYGREFSLIIEGSSGAIKIQ